MAYIMKKINKDNIDLIIEYYRQFIRLTAGEAALKKIDNYIETKLYNKPIEIPENNNTKILEKGILDNV